MCTNKPKFFKSVSTLLLTCLLAVLPSGVMAQEFTVDGLAYTVVEGSGAECLVSTYQDESLSGEISIPEMVQFEGLSYIVVGLESRAFESCEKITSVTIPNSVKSIGEFAFGWCSSLTSIVIPKSVTYIGSDAFSACHSLKSIEVEEGNSVYDSRENCNAIVQTASNVLVHGVRPQKFRNP